MFTLDNESEIKKVLRSLCMSYGWSFGVFWRFDHRNSMLLSLEDAYSEDYARSLTDNMLLQVHILGEGIIGQSAFDGNYRWLLSDSSSQKYSFTEHARIHQDNCDFSCEFSAGIKTMAVIPVELCGVLQLGSAHKILETPGFVDQTRQILRELGIIDRLVPLGISATSSLITDNIDQNEQFSHLISSYNSIPSSSCVDSQECSFGFDPLSFLGGSIENQCLDSFLHGPSNLHVFDELNSTEFLTTSLNDEFLTHFENVKREETLEDILFPPMIQNKNNIIGATEVKAGLAMAVPKKALFSELGLDQILSNRADSSSFAKSSIEDPIRLPNKRKVECFQESDNCFIADAKSCITDHTKATKKRARPGESTRPRPKDRQLIQDRIKELRDIIPNSAKCSIDSLLDRTIKHMLFMQGVTKYVDKLKRVDEAKAQKEVSNNSETSGSTAWAFEIGGHNPIVVEDLGNSGLMLIEMVCEEQGFFLEISDVIRGFGLTILKGVVEARDGKIWAQFIVEANRSVTRMEVLMKLLHLLKEPSTVGSNSKSVAERNNILDHKNTSLLMNYHHNQLLMSHLS